MSKQYETLYINDDGTAKVRMTIDDNVLEQDVAIGADSDEFDSNVKTAMAIFNSELTINNVPNVYTPPLDVPVSVSSLPKVPTEGVTNGS